MDHQDQHHEHHRKEREEKKQEHKEYEHQLEKKLVPFHPAWFAVLGIALIAVAVLVWTLVF